ncbi:MAG: DoxX family membrane protein [Ignavibacteria bacterium]|nr:DoxX family membrane protein [Ignavibacteria bacterium]MBT8381139.1 DoxX family membrane protein [Ignavibacteria bacterium]MBT8390984.1 DoxX family membrane protein [Ignavibacteria bacterium]NNJ54392.1 DoxX family membrane protein [Ignavibacteriaceae bacterium]NNL21704.1 DoxX family membrane protein [Ignavibacteriaceae bacterium]
MNKILNNSFLLLVARLVLGFVFIFAAVSKAAEPESFAQVIANYKLLPDFLINICAIVLPWIELCAGLLLLFGISVKENSVILSTLLIIFIAAISISLLRGLDIECGCFGTVDGAKVGLIKILENIGLLLLGLLLLKFDSIKFSLNNKNN